MKTTQMQPPATFDGDGYMQVDDECNEAVMITAFSKGRVSFHVSLRSAAVSVFLTHEQARAVAERLWALAATTPDAE